MEEAKGAADQAKELTAAGAGTDHHAGHAHARTVLRPLAQSASTTASVAPQLADLSQVEDHSRLEREQVHAVYEQIAGHFSMTRYKPWPVVEQFLRERPAGAVGCDVGCGNGKYLGVNPSVWTVGVDMYVRLPRGAELLRITKPGCPALVYVWALEQTGKRHFPGQDVLVPWHLPTRLSKSGPKPSTGTDFAAGGTQTQVGAAAAAGDVPSTMPSGSGISNASATTTVAREDGTVEVVYQRYYHLFRQGELEELVQSAGGRVLSSGYDRDNHYAIMTHADDSIFSC